MFNSHDKISNFGSKLWYNALRSKGKYPGFTRCAKLCHNVLYYVTSWGSQRCMGKQSVQLVRKLCNGDLSTQAFHQPYSLCPPRHSIIHLWNPPSSCRLPLSPSQLLPLPTSFPLPLCCPLPPHLPLLIAPFQSPPPHCSPPHLPSPSCRFQHHGPAA